jgi:hypothetical protein
MILAKLEVGMNRIPELLVAISFILTVFPPLWCKSPTAKITISGGALTSEIEITDSRILDLSGVWGGRFLDTSAAPAIAPPQVAPTYQVWLYIKSADQGVQRRHVLYYSPSEPSKKGLIYLPGKGQPWYSLNVSAILRYGSDGEWNYASPSWEELIKLVITRAEAAPTPRQ